jgi:hypothetical protein
MRQSNIVKKLKSEGYKVDWVKFEYWEVPKVEKTCIADCWGKNGTMGAITDFKYDDVVAAIRGKYRNIGDMFEYVETGRDPREWYGDEN